MRCARGKLRVAKREWRRRTFVRSASGTELPGGSRRRLRQLTGAGRPAAATKQQPQPTQQSLARCADWWSTSQTAAATTPLRVTPTDTTARRLASFVDRDSTGRTGRTVHVSRERMRCLNCHRFGRFSDSSTCRSPESHPTLCCSAFGISGYRRHALYECHSSLLCGLA